MKLKYYISPDQETEIDISDDVAKFNGIKIQTDPSDSSYFNFTVPNCSITLKNNRGKYSSRGQVFYNGHDRAGLRVAVEREDGRSVSLFKGLVNEVGSKEDILKSTVSIVALSKLSFLKRGVAHADIREGDSVADIIFKAFSDFGKLNFNPGSSEGIKGFGRPKDFTGALPDTTPFDYVRSIMRAYNVMVLDDPLTNETHVVSRIGTQIGGSFALTFQTGAVLSNYDAKILSFRKVNPGADRIFNRVTSGDFEASDENSIQNYGVETVNLDVNFQGDEPAPDFLNAMAGALFLEYASPALEVEVVVALSEVVNLVLNGDNEIDRLPRVGDYVRLWSGPESLDGGGAVFGQSTFGRSKYGSFSDNLYSNSFWGHNIINVMYNSNMTVTYTLRRRWDF